MLKSKNTSILIIIQIDDRYKEEVFIPLCAPNLLAVWYDVGTLLKLEYK
jgi:hypothetical protein